MSHYEQIDETNKRILALLMENSRVSYSEISDSVGITRVPVKERIKDMSERGIIEKFTVLVPSKYLDKPLPVFFEIDASPDQIENVATRVAEHPDIAIVYQMSGGMALHVHGFFANMDDVSVIIKEYLSRIPGITDIRTEFIIKRYKLNRSIMV